MPGTPVLINYLKSESLGLHPVSWGMSLGIQITPRWHRLCPRRRRRIRVRKTTRILRCAGVVYGRPRAVFVFVACVASARGFMSRLCRCGSRSALRFHEVLASLDC